MRESAARMTTFWASSDPVKSSSLPRKVLTCKSAIHIPSVAELETKTLIVVGRFCGHVLETLLKSSRVMLNCLGFV